MQETLKNRKKQGMKDDHNKPKSASVRPHTKFFRKNGFRNICIRKNGAVGAPRCLPEYCDIAFISKM